MLHANHCDSVDRKQHPGRAAILETCGPILTVIVVLLLGQACVKAQNSEGIFTENHKYSYGAETDFTSNYVWRGILVDNGPVMQPAAWLSISDFTLIGWSNLNLGQTPQNRRMDATDLTLMYDHNWRRLVIEPTFEAYLSRPPMGTQDPNTLEGALKLIYPVGPVRLFTKQSLDLLAYRGAYFGEAGAAYGRRITKRTAFDVSVRSGWASSKFNSAYVGVNKPAFNLVGAKSGFTYYASRSWYLRPHLEFDHIVDAQLRRFLPSPTVLSFGLEMGFGY